MIPETTKWHNCYDDGWKGIIVPESFQHPAKMSRGLLKCILAHAKEQGWLRSGGDVVVTEEILKEIKKDIDNNQYQQVE